MQKDWLYDTFVRNWKDRSLSEGDSPDKNKYLVILIVGRIPILLLAVVKLCMQRKYQNVSSY